MAKIINPMEAIKQNLMKVIFDTVEDNVTLVLRQINANISDYNFAFDIDINHNFMLSDHRVNRLIQTGILSVDSVIKKHNELLLKMINTYAVVDNISINVVDCVSIVHISYNVDSIKL